MKQSGNEEIRNKMTEIVSNNEYMVFLGIELLELEEGYARARMKYRKELLNPYGMFHGGSLYSLADIVAGTAACMSGHYVTTVSGNMNFMLPGIHTDYVYCEAVGLRTGKHLCVYEIKIKDDQGQLLDSGEFTYFVTDQEIAAEQKGGNPI